MKYSLIAMLVRNTIDNLFPMRNENILLTQHPSYFPDFPYHVKSGKINKLPHNISVHRTGNRNK